MGHDIDLPDVLPAVVEDLHATLEGYAGVGTEKVNRAIFIFGVFNDVLYVRFPGNVDFISSAANLTGDRPNGIAVEISADNDLCALIVKTHGHGFANPAGGAGHDNNTILKLHIAVLSGLRRSETNPSLRPGFNEIRIIFGQIPSVVLRPTGCIHRSSRGSQ